MYSLLKYGDILGNLVIPAMRFKPMTQSGSLGNTQREAEWLIPVLTSPSSVFWSDRNRNQQVQREHYTGGAVEPQWFLRHKSSAPPPFLPPSIAQQQIVAPLITKALLQLLGEAVPSFSLYAPTLPESPGSAKWFSASLRIQPDPYHKSMKQMLRFLLYRRGN